MFARLLVWLAIGMGGAMYVSHYENGIAVEQRRDLALRQFEQNDEVPQAMRKEHWRVNNAYMLCGVTWMVFGVLLFTPEIRKVYNRA